MKILFLTSTGISNKLIEWLRNVAEEEVIPYTEQLNLIDLQNLNPEFIISYNYRHIIQENILNEFGQRAINLHISLLPWNRGTDPNFWSFVEGNPKGVSIHILDKGIDTGGILFQKQIEFDDTKETLTTSYNTLHEEIQQLFMQNWTSRELLTKEPVPQKNTGSVHFRKDFKTIKHILGEEMWHISIPLLIERYKQHKHD